MHHRLRLGHGECGIDRLSILQVAFDEARTRIEGAAMALAKIIEDRNFVALIKKQFCADAADITGPANDENFHAP
jgi:hypothetical protein